MNLRKGLQTPKTKKKNKRIADAKPSKEYLKRQKLMIVDTYKDKKGNTKYVLADTFDS